MIVVNNLTKRYEDILAVAGISFKVGKGEVFGLLGPNGAGKTTTVEILECLRKPTSGESYIDGLDISKNSKQVKKIIGVQLQSASFFDKLTVYELIKMYATLYSAYPDIDLILKRVGLSEKAKSYYKPLSGGQKQRLSIAVALVNKPKVLFLDEPTTGLDPQSRRNMWELIKSIQSDGTTVVLTTHYMEEAEILCDRVAIMDEGKIVRINTPAQLIQELIDSGFKSEKTISKATLEDVFLNLTGKTLRED